MDVLLQPGGDRRDVSLRNTFPYVGNLLFHFEDHLCAIGAAECIGREVTECSARPVGILQAALPVRLRADAEIFLVKIIPHSGNIRHGKGSADQLLFNLVAHHYMQGIGQLVCFRSDQGRLRIVDLAVELLVRHVSQLFREDFPAGLQKRSRKCFASADDVFIKAALALVHAHGRAAVQAGVVETVVSVHFIDGVAALMQHGINRG